jgi:hypothetical protein
MNRFEQLIEYVINDEEAKARELFHEIVVEKSRQIYEDIMSEEELDEAKSTEEEDEDAERAGRRVAKDIEYDDKKDREMHEGMHDIDEMGGDASDQLIDDVEMDEQSDYSMEAEEEEIEGEEEIIGSDDDHHSDVGGDEELEDRVMDLEDKLEELMAEFEELMGDDSNGDMMGPDEGGDALEMDDTEEMDEMGMMPMAEAVSLKAAPKPVTSEEGNTNKKSPVAANAGSKGPIGSTVKPVHTGTDGGGRHDAAGAYSNQTKDLVGDFQNKAGTNMKGLKPAAKPHLAQATGVNTKSPVAKG